MKSKGICTISRVIREEGTNFRTKEPYQKYTFQCVDIDSKENFDIWYITPLSGKIPKFILRRLKRTFQNFDGENVEAYVNRQIPYTIYSNVNDDYYNFDQIL